MTNSEKPGGQIFKLFLQTLFFGMDGAKICPESRKYEV